MEGKRFLTLVFWTVLLFLSCNELSATAAKSFYEIELKSITNEPIDFKQFKNKVVLIANVASQCAFTNLGYHDLATLYERYKKKGFEAVATPCNQFGAQEPDPESKIETFAREKKGAKYLLSEKVDVNGENAHELYRFLKGEFLDGWEKKSYAFGDDIRWNFEFFLVSRKGKVVQRWPPGTNMNGPEVQVIISKALKEQAKTEL